MIIHPPAVVTDSQLQKQLCWRGLQASLARQVQSHWYFALGLKVLFLVRSCSRRVVQRWKWLSVAREVDAGSCSTVFFQDHA